MARSVEGSHLHALGRSIPRFFTSFYFILWVAAVASAGAGGIYKQAFHGSGPSVKTAAAIVGVLLAVGYPALFALTEMHQMKTVIANERAKRIAPNVHRLAPDSADVLAGLCAAALRSIAHR